MSRRESQEELRTRFDSVNASLAEHPLASEQVRRAYAIIESTDSDDKELVDKKLEDEDLPGLAEIGRIQAHHSLSWWKLHRERNKIIEKLEDIGGSGAN